MVEELDGRVRRWIQNVLAKRWLAAPLAEDAQGRATLRTAGAANLTPNGELTVEVGGGLATQAGSPEKVVVYPDHTLTVTPEGKLHAQPTTRDVQNFTGLPGRTLGDVLVNLRSIQQTIETTQEVQKLAIQVENAARESAFAETVTAEMLGVGTTSAELSWRELR